MNWKNATRAQLYEIAYNDPGATLDQKTTAAAEIKRRNRSRSGKPTKVTGRMEFLR